MGCGVRSGEDVLGGVLPLLSDMQLERLVILGNAGGGGSMMGLTLIGFLETLQEAYRLVIDDSFPDRECSVCRCVVSGGLH